MCLLVLCQPFLTFLLKHPSCHITCAYLPVLYTKEQASISILYTACVRLCLCANINNVCSFGYISVCLLLKSIIFNDNNQNLFIIYFYVQYIRKHYNFLQFILFPNFGYNFTNIFLPTQLLLQCNDWGNHHFNYVIHHLQSATPFISSILLFNHYTTGTGWPSFTYF